MCYNLFVYLYSHVISTIQALFRWAVKQQVFVSMFFVPYNFFLNTKFRRNSVNLSSIKKFLGLLNPGLCVPIPWICHSTVFHVEVLDAQRGPYPVQHCAHLNQDFRNENSSPNRSQERWKDDNSLGNRRPWSIEGYFDNFLVKQCEWYVFWSIIASHWLLRFD